jgi:rare lipoprotein A
MRLAAKVAQLSGEPSQPGDQPLPRFALGTTGSLNAQSMRTGYGTIALSGRSLRAVLIAGVLGMAPLAAATAATASESALPLQASAAAFEIAPLAAASGQGEKAAAVPDALPDATSLGNGTASYYAGHFQGRRTASGEAFDNGAMTAAHRTLPFGSLVRVTNPANGKSVIVRINDRGPFGRGRVIDLSRAAAEELGLIARGHATVELELVGG